MRKSTILWPSTSNKTTTEYLSIPKEISSENGIDPGGKSMAQMPPLLKVDLDGQYMDDQSESSREQPYHRVVSAPPGRIGLTFVQYRGNCLVSDVCPESPLSGWVFPSDIVIAIDEMPVCGLRVKEIVKILTSRKEQRRALRVISSHAMKELTQSSAALIDG